MITGVVTSDWEAVVSVQVRGIDGGGEVVDAVLDTGFNGFLALPVSLVSQLRLPFAGTTRVTLGDGSEVHLDMFEAMVNWDNREQNVVVLRAEGGALVGMSLLAGYRVTLEVEEGGVVRIESLP